MTEEEKKKTKANLIKAGIATVILGGTVYGVKKLYEHYQKNTAEKQVLQSPEVQQAMALYAAMNPSGFEWMRHFDGTSKEALYNTASEITDLNTVEDEYTKLYQSDLMDDLRQKLGSDGLTKFLNTLKFNSNTVENKGNGKGKTKQKIGFATNLLIVTTAKTNLRKTPKDISHWSFHSNIIKTADKGTFLGGATGKTAFDNNGASNTGTLYVEIKSVAFDTKKAVFFWVAASQVTGVTKADYDANHYPLISLKEKETLGNPYEGQKTVVTCIPTPIMNNSFQLVALAKPTQALGYELMQLDDKKGNVFVKFISEGQKEYWVNKKFIQLI
jgi:hypothetical protein